MWKVPLFDSKLGEREKRAVQEVLESGWLTMGPVTRSLEEDFAELCGTSEAIAVANGTAALHLALKAAGIGAGDEVIVPSLTFVATANAVIHAGARPVFADISGEDDLNIAPEAVAAAIGPQTAAIIAVHYAGQPADMKALRRLAEKHGLMLIEDAAHAPGAGLPDARSTEGRCGGLGDIACFSFYSNKNMTCGEGGMVTTNDGALATRVRLLRSHGMTSSVMDRHAGAIRSYDVVDAGFNYRIDEMRATLAKVQLEGLLQRNAERRLLNALYHQALGEVEGISLPFSSERERAASSCHVMSALLDEGIDLEAFRASLKEDGVQTSHHYPAIHLLDWYREHEGWREGCLPITESVTRRQVTLPLYPGMGDERVQLVVAAVERALAQQIVGAGS